MSSLNRDLTPHAYTRQCPPHAARPAAIGFSTPGSQPVPVRTGCRSRDQPPLCIQVAGLLPLRWGSCTGGSTECLPQPAADARSAATAAGRGSPSPAPPPPAHRQAAGRSLLHRGQDAQSPWSGAVAESRAQTSSPAYEREHPGDLMHIDVKKLARFRKVGHRITGKCQQGRSAGVGYDRVHVAIDDATCLVYVQVRWTGFSGQVPSLTTEAGCRS